MATVHYIVDINKYMTNSELSISNKASFLYEEEPSPVCVFWSSSSMTYHRACNKRNTVGVTCDVDAWLFVVFLFFDFYVSV